MELNDLESKVLDYLLAGAHPAHETLRVQLSRAQVKAREYTGVGFFIDLIVPPDVPRIASTRMVIDNVDASIDGLEHGAGFVLFVTDGVLDCLEGFAYAEPGPAVIEGVRLRYSQPGSMADR